MMVQWMGRVGVLSAINHKISAGATENHRRRRWLGGVASNTEKAHVFGAHPQGTNN
jgi:hypothetical protein